MATLSHSPVSGAFIEIRTVEFGKFSRDYFHIYQLYRSTKNNLVAVMRQQSFKFSGRGNMGGDQIEPYRMITCAEGTVMAIIITYHGVEFIHGFCRKALFDRWGLHCSTPFTRSSDAACTRSWSEPMGKDLFLFHSARLDIIKEAEWMKTKES